MSLTAEMATVETVNRIGAVSAGREYVAGGSGSYVNPLFVQKLNPSFDDITGDFGMDVYVQMMRDPAVSSSIATLKTLVLAEPLRATAAVQDIDDPDFAKASEYADFIQWCLDNPERPLVEVLDEMLDALWRGSYVAEVVLRDETSGKYKGKQTLRKLAPKNPARYWMVVDRFFDVLGIVRQYSISVDTTNMSFQGHALVPRNHLAIMTFWGVGGDPRGSSILRPAYNGWYMRQQAWPAYLRWLVQWSTPGLVGMTPVGAPPQIPVVDVYGMPEFNSDGTMKMESPEAAMLRALVQFQGGSALALAGGSSIDKIQSEGNGQAFSDGLAMLLREIVLAILRVTRVTTESQHGSKADSEGAKDVLDIFCDWIKQHVVSMIKRDVVTPLMVNNFGPDSLALSPTITLAGTEKADIAKLGAVIAQLFACGYLDISQLTGTDALLNLPERDLESQLRKEADAEDAARMASMAQARLFNPSAGDGNPIYGRDPEEAPVPPVAPPVGKPKKGE